MSQRALSWGQFNAVTRPFDTAHDAMHDQHGGRGGIDPEEAVQRVFKEKTKDLSKFGVLPPERWDVRRGREN